MVCSDCQGRRKPAIAVTIPLANRPRPADGNGRPSSMAGLQRRAFMSDPMYPPPPPPGMAPPPMAPMGSANAAAQVAGPATGLMIAAVVGIVWALLMLCIHFLGIGMGALSSLNADANQRFGRFLGGGLGIIGNIIG